MTISAIEISIPTVEHVTVTEDTLTVELSDGRTIAAPLAWFPGIHWPQLDEDLSVEGLSAGNPSGESQTSFKRRLEGRTARPTRRSTQPSTNDEF
jgi:hypothetical protein